LSKPKVHLAEVAAVKTVCGRGLFDLFYTEDTRKYDCRACARVAEQKRRTQRRRQLSYWLFYA